MRLTKNLSRSVLLAAICMISLASRAQSVIHTAASLNTSVDYKRLERIDTLVDSYINKEWINGVVTIIVKDRQVAQHKGYGYSNAAGKKQMDKNSIFRIASQTKAIASTGMLILYDEGKLSLNDPVSKYIPEFAHSPEARMELI